ncbi:uncharacterized protein RAG0_06254 [Rhynchosporium agropyri]|uniref:Uncharacterized protein n=1 Tax=Rhynchosporium agropyri TaxID=914238 RepID=A0A1E1KGL1_9HELO|nr:uncharacterized protein RAG0_06254 [Rhynchosporium agropyri]
MKNLVSAIIFGLSAIGAVHAAGVQYAGLNAYQDFAGKIALVRRTSAVLALAKNATIAWWAKATAVTLPKHVKAQKEASRGHAAKNISRLEVCS